eukprot:tig00000058_g739.t1
MRGTSDILEGIPRTLLKSVAKHYTKVHKRQQQDGSEEGSGEEEEEDPEGGRGRGGSSGSSDSEGGRSDASDGSGCSSGEEGGRGRGRRRRARRSASHKRGKKEAPAPSDSEAEKPVPVAAAAAAAAELPVSPPPALAPVPESAAERRGGGGGGGSRGGSAGSGSRASSTGPRVPSTSLAAPGEARLALQLQSDAAGSGRSSSSTGPGAPAAVVISAVGFGGEGEGDEGRLDPSPPASALSSTKRLGSGTGKPAAGSDEAGGSGRQPLILALLQDDSSQSHGSFKLEGGSKPKAGKGRDSRSDSGSEEDPKLRLQLGRGGPRRQNAASAAQGGTPGGGILRRPSMQGQAFKLEAAGAAPAQKEKAGEKLMITAAEASGGDEEEGEKEKSKRHKKEKAERKEKKKEEDEKEKKKKKDAAAAAAGEGHGPDILTLLTRKYTVAFIVIAGIFIVNFVVCFVILGSGRNFAIEINLGGRRRSIARELAFYARELYINDDLFLPRFEVHERLVQKAALFKQVHQALKYGDPELRVYGANGRNKALDNVMYDAECLRIDASKCVDGRVNDMQLVGLFLLNGLDALVVGLLDLVIEIMQEAAPDLLLTGKEDPRTAAAFRRNYERLNSEKLTALMEIDDGDLDDGLAQAALAIIAESQASMAVVELMEASAGYLHIIICNNL